MREHDDWNLWLVQMFQTNPVRTHSKSEKQNASSWEKYNSDILFTRLGPIVRYGYVGLYLV